MTRRLSLSIEQPRKYGKPEGCNRHCPPRESQARASRGKQNTLSCLQRRRIADEIFVVFFLDQEKTTAKEEAEFYVAGERLHRRDQSRVNLFNIRKCSREETESLTKYRFPDPK